MIKFKRFLVLLLTMAMVLTMGPLNAFATDVEGLETNVSEERQLPEESGILTEPEAADDESYVSEKPETSSEDTVIAENTETSSEEPEVPVESACPVEESEVPATSDISAGDPENDVAEPESLEADVAAVAAAAEAGAEEDDCMLQTGIIVNPLYEDLSDAAEQEIAPISDSDEIVVDSTCYNSVSSAGLAVRSHMKNRDTAFTISYTASTAPTQSQLNQMIDTAVAHTGKPTEGDYLMWQWQSYSARGKWTPSGNSYNINLTFQFTYYTTRSQENQVNSKVSALRKSLGLSGKSQYEKVCLIYDWICDNVTYDYDHLYMGTDYPLQFTAYGACIDNTCVCQGYAVFFYRMALEEGIDARVITGDGGGPHAWNIVRLDGKYYNLDSTWDAGVYSYSWFLKCPGDFPDHTREIEYNTSSFNSKYPMGTKNYAPPAQPKLVSVENVANGVQITWNKVSGATKYNVYRRSGSSGWSKINTVTGNSYTNTGVTSGRTYYYTVRAISNSAGSTFDRTGLGILCLTAPTVTRITNSHAGINLWWKETPGANGYNIYRRTGNGSYSRVGVVKGSSNTTFTDTAVQSKGGSTYTYRVVAYKGSYKSIYRVSSSIVRMDTPAIKSLKSTSNGVAVSWNAISGCSGYNIYRKTDNGSYVKLGNVTGSSSSSFTDKKVKGKKGTFTYKVEAYRGSSKSAYHAKSITLR